MEQELDIAITGVLSSLVLILAIDGLLSKIKRWVRARQQMRTIRRMQDELRHLRSALD